MDVLRTPEDRFADLPDYPFAPHYHRLTPYLRLHYLDEGPADAAPVLMLHGEPTWSYLYRHMIGPVAEAGNRVLVPDLIGFGKSDKPALAADHSYARQVGWIRQWIEALDLREITLARQDWGSLIGLRLVAEMPERFAAVVLSNGGLPDGGRFSIAFNLWRAFSRHSPVFPIGRIVQRGSKRKLSKSEIAAYDSPFPDRRFTAGPRIYPSLVPLEPEMPGVEENRQAWSVLRTWRKPFVCAFSDGDPITRGGDARFIADVPGAAGQPHVRLSGGHFIQEDDPEGFAKAILAVTGAPAAA